jgi:hypothetical protein
MTPSNDPQRRPESKAYRETLRINALFFIAWITVAYTSVKAVPGGDVQDFFLTALAPVAAGVAYKIIKGGGSIFWESPAQQSLFKDPDELTRERQLDSLPAPKPPRNQTTARNFKLGAFAILSIPVGIAFWRWHTGEGVVNWAQILPNIPAIIALAALWSVIERKNRQTAALLAEEARRHKS